MIYANLLIFLTAIFLFSIDTVPEAPATSGGESLFLLLAGLGVYFLLVRRLFRRAASRTANGYFRSERQATVLALLFYAGVLFAGDVKYYLSFLALGGRLPAVVNVAGLALFLAFLALMWLAARRSYSIVFGRSYPASTFLASNLKSNLPIVLPWIVLSLVYDLIALAPVPGLKELSRSGYGDVLFFGLFLVFVMLFFPPLVRRLWDCRPLAAGPLKEHLVAFCARQDFHADIYVWPLFEGRVLTAGVMGLVPGLRYILLTPAIIETMTIGELEAVMAHEIGHVKKKHLLLYVLLIGGFGVMAGFLAEPVLYTFLSFDWVYRVMETELMAPETVIGLVGGLPLLALMLLYFRFVFGYFIRNFERQADLYVFRVFGNSRALVAAFDKIAGTSGHSKEKPNWHHFGIGERIDYLERCEREPAWIAHQDRKIRNSLIAYLLILGAVVGLVRQIPTEQLVRSYEEKYIELVLLRKVEGFEDQALWFRLLGDWMINKKMEQRALAAYNKALEFESGDPELLNNLAWLLLTSADPALRDPSRALTLARTAATAAPLPHILDTLATAYWANGLIEEAIRTERQALQGNPEEAEFYRRQLERFRTSSYGEEPDRVN